MAYSDNEMYEKYFHKFILLKSREVLQPEKNRQLDERD